MDWKFPPCWKLLRSKLRKLFFDLPTKFGIFQLRSCSDVELQVFHPFYLSVMSPQIDITF
jgi:hypothetical protein